MERGQDRRDPGIPEPGRSWYVYYRLRNEVGKSEVATAQYIPRPRDFLRYISRYGAKSK
jgi:hypothetical protein